MDVIDADVLSRIVEIQSEIVGEISTPRVMQKIVEHSQALTHSQGAIVELVDGECMVYEAASGIAESYVGLRLKRADSLSGLCVKNAEILRCDDSDQDERVDRAACRRIGLRSMLVVPLAKDGDAIGVLKVMSASPNAFSEKDVYLLQLLAGFITNVMHTTAAFQESQARALHDELTGLANRALFRDRVSYELSRLQRVAACIATTFIDLNEFKSINDTHGHACGDAVLVETAKRLRAVIRETDTAARFGGDEFAVLSINLGRDDDPNKLTDRLEAAIGKAPFDIGSNRIQVTASVGTVSATQADTDYDSLINSTDAMMYRMKRAKKRIFPQFKSPE